MHHLEKRQATQAGLSAHLKALGLDSIKAYRTWCRSNNLSESLQKSSTQRRKELKNKSRIDFENSAKDSIDLKGNSAGIIREIGAGRLEKNQITHPGLRKVFDLIANSCQSDGRRQLFTRVLIAAVHQGDFLDLNPVIELFGHAKGNTLLDGLYAITGHEDRWIRAPESWQPAHRSLHRRFSELVRHIFAHYSVPTFMDSAWFAGDHGNDQQRWFIHLGQGGNIRTAALPIAYTKKMSHLFLQAPNNYAVIHALRWGQILALGGSKELVGHINATFLGERLEHEDFWKSVIHFFINNPMLDSSYVGPIVEYVNNRKFVSLENSMDDGAEAAKGPPDPGFSMKGRKTEPMIDLVDEWHVGLSRERRTATGTWSPCGIPAFEYLEDVDNTDHVVKWTITELLSRKEIFDEGKAMKHCVRSYVQSSTKGIKSVWSVQREDTETHHRKRVLTIAVKNDVRKVVQARGKCNAMAGIRPNSQRESTVLRRDLELLEQGRRIMKLWGNENDITVPFYT